MKIRHVNNIIIELEEWEVKTLHDFIEDRMIGAIFSPEDLTILTTLRDELERLTARKA